MMMIFCRKREKRGRAKRCQQLSFMIRCHDLVYNNDHDDDNFCRKRGRAKRCQQVSRKSPADSASFHLLCFGWWGLDKLSCRQTFHPEIGKIWQKLSKVALANSWQELPKKLARVTKSCQQLSKVATSCQKLRGILGFNYQADIRTICLF